VVLHRPIECTLQFGPWLVEKEIREDWTTAERVGLDPLVVSRSVRGWEVLECLLLSAWHFDLREIF
jgi:hypothetical protein